MRRAIPIARLISSAYRLQMACLTRKLTSFGLGGGSYSYLLTIVENPGIPQCELVGRLAMDRTTASKMLSELERKGLITRRANPDDARGVILHPTEQGASLYHATEEAITDYRKLLLKDFSREEETQLQQLLSRLTANIREGMEQDKGR